MIEGFGAMVDLMREDLMVAIKLAAAEQVVEKPLQAAQQLSREEPYSTII
jgi:hypothetical protein